MQNFEADTLVILKRCDYDAFLKKFRVKKNDFARFNFIKNFKIYSYVEFYGGFNGTNHLKDKVRLLESKSGDFFEIFDKKLFYVKF